MPINGDATDADLEDRETATGLDPRADALARHLGIDADEVEPASYGENVYEAEGAEYLVLTDDEADAAVVDYVRESVWAFSSSFLATETGLPEEVFAALSKKSEDANDPILRMVEELADNGLEGFAERAAEEDGRGHFLAQYDGEELEVYFPTEDGDARLYAYRTN